jgi:hypothetical protein
MVIKFDENYKNSDIFSCEIVSSLLLDMFMKNYKPYNINFENDFLLKRCLYASRSFSLGLMSHSFVFEGVIGGHYYTHYINCFYFKIASQR